MQNTRSWDGKNRGNGWALDAKCVALEPLMLTCSGCVPALANATDHNKPLDPSTNSIQDKQIKSHCHCSILHLIVMKMLTTSIPKVQKFLFLFDEYGLTAIAATIS